MLVFLNKQEIATGSVSELTPEWQPFEKGNLTINI